MLSLLSITHLLSMVAVRRVAVASCINQVGLTGYKVDLSRHCFWALFEEPGSNAARRSDSNTGNVN